MIKTENFGRGSTLLYLLLCCSLTLISGEGSFVLAGFIYAFIIFFISRTLSKRLSTPFFNLTTLFLFIYSIYGIGIHYIFINKTFSDYFIGPDENWFFFKTKRLAQLTYSEIWTIPFKGNSNWPLFWSWLGTLYKINDIKSPYFSFLFLRLNGVYFGSFIPGMVFLLSRKITSEKRAITSALVYGFFSFTMLYSVAFLRDIHIALIYSVALYYLIYKKSDFKYFVLLLILFACAFYIRVESGLFFLAFIFIWLFKSRQKNKLLFVFSSICVLGLLIYIGGLDYIFNVAEETTGAYSQRTLNQAGANSLLAKLKKLPAPLSYLGVSGFSQIGSFPFWLSSTRERSMTKNLSFITDGLASLFWFYVWFNIIIQRKDTIRFVKQYTLEVSAVLLFIILVSYGQPFQRRLMAVYPIIYMAFISVYPKKVKLGNVLLAIFVYVSLLLIYYAFKL